MGGCDLHVTALSCSPGVGLVWENGVTRLTTCVPEERMPSIEEIVIIRPIKPILIECDSYQYLQIRSA